MAQPRLSKLELQVMTLFWDHGAQTVREAQERFPEKTRPAYTTVQTVVNRLEAKGALARARKLGNIAAAEPDVLVSGNIGCLQHLAAGAGKLQPILHLAELIDWAEGGPTPMPLVEMPATLR